MYVLPVAKSVLLTQFVLDVLPDQPWQRTLDLIEQLCALLSHALLVKCQTEITIIA
jgi:hypothetical protein